MGPARCRLAWAVLFVSLCAVSGAEEPRFAGFDRLSVKLQQPILPVDPDGEIVLMMYHNYPSSLTNVRVVGSAPGLTVECADPAVGEMLPTSFAEVPLRLALTEPASAEMLDLELTITADEVASPVAVAAVGMPGEILTALLVAESIGAVRANLVWRNAVSGKLGADQTGE